jgi:ankyrin repeat protein
MAGKRRCGCRLVSARSWSDATTTGRHLWRDGLQGYSGLVKLLVEAGASLNADNGGGRTPLMFAAMFGNRDVIVYLLAEGADPSSQTSLGSPPCSWPN